MDKTTVGNLCKPYIGQLKLDDNTLIDYFDIASVDNIEKQITGYTTYKFAEAPSRARKKVEKGKYSCFDSQTKFECGCPF